MTNQSSDRNEGRKPNPGTPIWVKIFAYVAVALVIVIIILHVTGNSFGGH
jgi:hypothetical protein